MNTTRIHCLIALAALLPQDAAAKGPACQATAPCKHAARKDIVATAVEAGRFKTLAAALKAAGLVEALQGGGPFTVFAPTDEAFAKLPKEALAHLLKPENKAALVRILKYHVVKGRKGSSAVLASRALTTLAGPSVHVTKLKDGAAINQSRLIKTDIAASNGIIHVIDAVLLPPEQKKEPREEARRMIESAVARGAPLYNHGDHGGCARLYEQAARRMLRMSAEVITEAARARLARAVDEAARSHDAGKQAWALRRGLDDVYQMMSTTPGR